MLWKPEVVRFGYAHTVCDRETAALLSYGSLHRVSRRSPPRVLSQTGRL